WPADRGRQSGDRAERAAVGAARQIAAAGQTAAGLAPCAREGRVRGGAALTGSRGVGAAPKTPCPASCRAPTSSNNLSDFKTWMAGTSPAKGFFFEGHSGERVQRLEAGRPAVPAELAPHDALVGHPIELNRLPLADMRLMAME